MATLSEIMQDYVNLPYSDLLAIANRSLGDLVEALEKNVEREDLRTHAVILLMSACIGVDGRFSELEYKFVCDILGKQHDYNSLKSMIAEIGDSEGRDVIDGLLDAFSDIKKPALAFCLCFLAVDETITREEVAFLNKLLDE